MCCVLKMNPTRRSTPVNMKYNHNILYPKKEGKCLYDLDGVGLHVLNLFCISRLHVLFCLLGCYKVGILYTFILYFTVKLMYIKNG